VRNSSTIACMRSTSRRSTSIRSAGTPVSSRRTSAVSPLMLAKRVLELVRDLAGESAHGARGLEVLRERGLSLVGSISAASSTTTCLRWRPITIAATSKRRRERRRDEGAGALRARLREEASPYAGTHEARQERVVLKTREEPHHGELNAEHEATAASRRSSVARSPPAAPRRARSGGPGDAIPPAAKVTIELEDPREHDVQREPCAQLAALGEASSYHADEHEATTVAGRGERDAERRGLERDEEVSAMVAMPGTRGGEGLEHRPSTAAQELVGRSQAPRARTRTERGSRRQWSKAQAMRARVASSRRSDLWVQALKERPDFERGVRRPRTLPSPEKWGRSTPDSGHGTNLRSRAVSAAIRCGCRHSRGTPLR
jgi:hypothetical protein